MLGEEGTQVIGDSEQSRAIPAGNCHDSAALKDEIWFGEQGEPCARQAWIDAEDQSKRG
jgi:hypothetical protein